MREDGWRPWRLGFSDPLPGLAQVIGHRGAAARAPENTLAGQRKAHELGAGWVEFDVMLSSDGVPILIHDETLERTTSGSGRVDGHSAAEIQALNAGSWFDPAFRDERVPTLSEAVAVLLELNLGAHVEIKPSTGYAQRTGEVVAALLQRTWPPGGPPLLLSSFERPALAAARAVAPELPRGLLSNALRSDWAQAMTGLGCTTLHLDHRQVRPAMLRDLAAESVPVLLYTVNNGRRARELLAAGAVAVISDASDLLSSGA
jgi:glycerophosphoryl diester phosphodiesterase